MTSFRAAVEAHDPDAFPALLAPGVTFRSPVVFQPYEGRELVAAILRGAFRVFEDFRYEQELHGADGREVALVFRARIGEREIHGCDFLHLDDDGLIDEFTVMVRPQKAAQAVSVAMNEQFELIKQELGG
ncbi:nuclear transport factor 2 family protein [Patulibacter minatonensis]|uniref:nuclear transport factor 2 family protein n=1 Tax=Patulibacter minatonensis TaxID=298163 RepID=UPI00047C7244|nr:nuclear transport factor 2 family protein [Patulibacter minatonensis]